MLEEIEEKYKLGIPVKFYESFKLIVDGETLDVPRGHGLGMANHLTSLM